MFTKKEQQDMKAVIMAAGKGTRMLPLTEKVPKVLVEVDGKPFLYYVLKSLEKAGFDEFGIIAGYMKEKVQDFIDRYGFNAVLIEQKQQLGTADAVKQARSFTEDENFVVIGGDNLFDVSDLKSFNVDDDLNYVAGLKVSDPEKYGVLVVEGSSLVRIYEKPKEFVGNLINAGLYKFTPEIYNAISNISKSPRGEFELTDAITLLADEAR